MLTIDRGPDMLDWFAIDPELSFHVPGPICGAHWANLLHRDPRRNEEVVARWVKPLRPYGDDFYRTLSTSTGECWTQFVHHQMVQAWRERDMIHLDFTALDRLPTMPLLDSFLVKVAAAEGSRFVSEDLLLDAAWDARLKYFRVQMKREGKAARATVRVIGAASS